MQTIHAIYENGVFRPTERIDLPDRSEVTIVLQSLNRLSYEPRSVPAKVDDEGMKAIYAILSERYASGESDVAARHNEHQP